MLRSTRSASADSLAPWRGQALEQQGIDRDRVRLEQVRTLYRNCPFGVVAATLVSILLASVLSSRTAVLLGLSLPTLWSAAVALCCVGHLLLCIAFWRSRPSEADWRRWMVLFTAMALIEGITWGVGAVLLIAPDNPTEAIVILLAWAGVMAAGVMVFGVYPPTFFAFLYPALSPHLWFVLTYRPPYFQLQAALITSFLIALPVIAVTYSVQLVHAYRLQFANRDLAEAWRAQKERADAANLAKSQFLAAASHDLRQPVHALGLFVGALLERRLPADVRAIVTRMETSVGALGELFSTLLDVSALDAGAVRPDIVSYPIGELLHRLENDFAREAEAKGLALRCARTTLSMRSDPRLVERILRNLLSNAVRYTEKGGILVGCRRSAGAVRFEVWDTGIGIAKDQTDLIFQEFYQVSNPARDRSKGVGLGLSIVRRTTELLHATLEFNSRPDKGSVFKLTVDRSSADNYQPPKTVVGGAKARILILDDEPYVLAAMKMLLLSWGYAVEAFASLNSASDALEQGFDPELIVSDFRLPGEETGIAAIERLRAISAKAIPAILVTGETSSEPILEAKRSGLLVLHKPLVKSRLRAALNTLLRQNA